MKKDSLTPHLAVLIATQDLHPAVPPLFGKVTRQTNNDVLAINSY
jgi:hypothetical protein